MVDTTRSAVAELAASQHRAFTRKQAAELNFSRARVATAIRSGWLAEPIPGVLVVRDGPATWHQRLMIVVLASGGHGVASHRSAARLHEFDGFDSPRNAAIEASVPRSSRLVVPTAAVIHHVTPLDPADITVVDGIPCTARNRTLCDLGSVVRPRELVQRALTSARRQGIDLAGLHADAERLHRPGQAGTGTLLRLLATIPWEGKVPDSWFEELLALCLKDPSLPPIVQQCPIVNHRGQIIARTDIGFPSIRLGLEAHSRKFHFGPRQERLDEDRDIAAAICGWELTYLGWYATKRPAEVLQIVKELVAEGERLFGSRSVS